MPSLRWDFLNGQGLERQERGFSGLARASGGFQLNIHHKHENAFPPESWCETFTSTIAMPLPRYLPGLGKARPASLVTWNWKLIKPVMVDVSNTECPWSESETNKQKAWNPSLLPHHTKAKEKEGSRSVRWGQFYLFECKLQKLGSLKRWFGC